MENRKLPSENQSQFLARKEVCSMLKISRSTLWRIERKDTGFPQPINLGIKKELWSQDEIISWAYSGRAIADPSCIETAACKLRRS